MNSILREKLIDPVNHESLHLSSSLEDGTEIISGELKSKNGQVYAIRNGIPRFVTTEDSGQLQTKDAFAYKWQKKDVYDTPKIRATYVEWLPEKYGFESFEAWVRDFSKHEYVLDIGCGSGFSSSIWLNSEFWEGQASWVGVDISEAIDVAQDRLNNVPNTHFVQGDALQLPFPDESFDAIFSEGVLHHTPSTREALLSGARVLSKGGTFSFYVYRKKSPLREFADDYIRDQIKPLSDEDSWEALRPLTQLGQALAELDAEITLTEDIPLLGIKAGTHNVQRLIYWHFIKLFWNDNYSFEGNVLTNFDWYRPQYAHRQTEDEVRQWCREANLNITWFHEQESGFTVRAVKE